MRKIATVIVLALLGAVIIAPTPLQAQSASAGGGGGILNFDLKNYIESSKTLKTMYDTYQQVQKLTISQEYATKVLGIDEEDYEFARDIATLAGNIANTLCNLRKPSFFFSFDFPYTLPDFPSEPCDIAALLPYDTDYYNEVMGNINIVGNNTINNPKKMGEIMADPKKLLSLTREVYKLSSRSARDYNGVLALRARVEDKFNKVTVDTIATASSTPMQTILTATKLESLREKKPKSIRSQQALALEFQAIEIETNLKILNAIAQSNNIKGFELLRGADPVDPYGDQGRQDVCATQRC